MAETVGDRLALIRQAIGTIAKPISLEALGELVGFDKHKMSRIANESQEMKKSDAEALASVDPLKRGPAWLMFGDEEGGQGAPTNISPKTDRPRRGSDIPVVDGDPRKYAQEVKTPPARKRRKRPPNDKTAMAV